MEKEFLLCDPHPKRGSGPAQVNKGTQPTKKHSSQNTIKYTFLTSPISYSGTNPFLLRKTAHNFNFN